MNESAYRRNRRTHTFLVAFVVIIPTLLTVSRGWTQQHEGAVEVHLCCTSAPDPEVDTYAKVVGDTISVVLERRGVTVRSEPTEDTVLRYEYHLVGFLPRIHVFVSVCDAAADTRITGALTTARGNITLYSAIDELIVSLEPTVDDYLRRRSNPDGGVWPIAIAEPLLPFRDDSESASPRYEELFSGTVVSSDFVAAQGVLLPVRISQEGFYTEEIMVPITEGQQELPAVPLRPLRRLGVDLHYGYPRTLGAGAGVRYYPLPDRVFTAFEVAISMTGFYGVTPGRMVHTDPRLLVGYVPLGHMRVPVQPVISTGVGLISTFVSYDEETAPRYLDWYWNVINLAVEVGQGMVRPYLRGGINYYVETERGLWANGLNPDQLSPELIAGTVLRW